MIESRSIHAWLEKDKIKTDTGVLLDFYEHPFMWDIYSDLSPRQVIMKAAQVTMSTAAILKAFWIAKHRKIDLIYTLPTESDRNSFVGSKVNRLVSQNPALQEWVKDKDSIEQKQVGNNFIHFRGTWTQRAAIMVPSELNIYDEIDSSKQDTIEQYATRLQHSKLKWQWYFSHPSAPDFGVDRYWNKSDQKHWFITCGACKKEQYLDWPDSIDIEREMYICKFCHAELSDDMRRQGRWVKKHLQSDYSGYWIPLLICSWVSAKEIIEYYRDKTEEYFYNKVLGKPFIGAGNKLTWEAFSQNLSGKARAPARNEQIVIGIDTGLKLDYVMGDRQGLFFHATASSYKELDQHMARWEQAIAIIDAGGDLIASREFYERWPGRVFLCHLTGDRKTKELVQWKEGDEYGNCLVDRYRIIQFVVDEFGTRRIPVAGESMEWQDYYQDWRNLTRIKVLNPVTGETMGYKWVRSGRDHKALATCFWRVGMDRYGWGGADILSNERTIVAPAGYPLSPDEHALPVTPEGKHPFDATIESLREESVDWRDS